MIAALRHYRALPTAVHLLYAGTLISRMGAFFAVFLTIYISPELDYGIIFATQCIGFFGLGGIAAALLGGHLQPEDIPRLGHQWRKALIKAQVKMINLY